METLTTCCSLPYPWPSGKYRVDVFLGMNETGTSDGCIHFAIREDDNQMQSATLTVSNDGSEVRGDEIHRDSGPLRVLFKSRFACHVRKESFIEWRAGDAVILKLAVPEGKFDVFHSDISLEKLWPVAQYTVRLVLNGDCVHVKKFRCVDEWGCEIKPVALTPDCGALFAEFNKGEPLHVDKMEVVWTFGENTRIASVPFAAGDYNEVKSDCTLQKPWPVGTYNVSLFADDVLTCRKKFEIAK
jgi:hypothetical protein